MLCPNCRKLINRDERNCPYCGTSRPGSWWKNNRFIGGFNEPSDIIRLIIHANVGMYILSLLINPHASSFALHPFAFLSPSPGSLVILGATGTQFVGQQHGWWTLLTANYLHGSLMHILFNMMALRQIGPLVIEEYGSYRMLAIYTLGGVFGFILSFLAGVQFTIGASAAVCSLIGAVLYYGKSRGGNYGQNLFHQVRGWAISIFVFGLLVPGINNWGHGGGMAAGALFGFLLGYHERNRETIRHKFIGISCVAITALGLAWSVLRGVVSLLPR